MKLRRKSFMFANPCSSCSRSSASSRRRDRGPEQCRSSFTTAGPDTTHLRTFTTWDGAQAPLRAENKENKGFSVPFSAKLFQAKDGRVQAIPLQAIHTLRGRTHRIV